MNSMFIAYYPKNIDNRKESKEVSSNPPPPHPSIQVHTGDNKTLVQKKFGHQVASLENWGGGLKSLSWHANSPHTPSIQTLQHTTTKILHRLQKKINHKYIYIESIEKNKK